MNFFNNIYASSYRAYQQYNDGPRLSSVCVVAIIQSALLLLILIVIEKIFAVKYYISKTYSTFLELLLIILLFNYYSEGRTREIVERFAQKPIQERRLWGWITVLLIIAPIVFIGILLHKPSVV